MQSEQYSLNEEHQRQEHAKVLATTHADHLEVLSLLKVVDNLKDALNKANAKQLQRKLTHILHGPQADNARDVQTMEFVKQSSKYFAKITVLTLVTMDNLQLTWKQLAKQLQQNQQINNECALAMQTKRPGKKS